MTVCRLLQRFTSRQNKLPECIFTSNILLSGCFSRMKKKNYGATLWLNWRHSPEHRQSRTMKRINRSEAGEKAAANLKPLIEAEDFIVEIIKLPDNRDPGELDFIEVRSIAEYITK